MTAAPALPPADPLAGRAPIGAQPDRFVMNPSRAYPWYGWRDPGERFTRTQLWALRRLGHDPAAVEAITVFREATKAEMWWPTTGLPPVFSFACPVRRRRGERVVVLAPDGTEQTVRADGWVRAPSTKPF